MSKQKIKHTAIYELIQTNPTNPVHAPELNPELSDIIPQLENVIAFVNPKSGGKKGEVILELLKNYLNLENVFDLSEGGPKKGLEMHKDKSNLRIIACGGDGTAGWILSVIDEIEFAHPPALAILPLGTGNDLARTFGWGGGFNNEPLYDFIYKVINGKIVNLDRWTISAKPTPQNVNDEDQDDSDNENDSLLSAQISNKLPLSVINNYFSIGADAKVALDFHKAREKNPEMFNSTVMNKIEYIKNYSKDLINQSCKHLIQNIKVFEIDGEDCLRTLKNLNCHSIIFLNIPSYASGTNPWKSNKIYHDRQSYCDGKIEILGFQTSGFILLQMGGKGDPIGQACKVRIVTSSPMPMQVDGEPVLFQAGEIIINLKNKASMISANEKEIYGDQNLSASKLDQENATLINDENNNGDYELDKEFVARV